MKKFAFSCLMLGLLGGCTMPYIYYEPPPYGRAYNDNSEYISYYYPESEVYWYPYTKKYVMFQNGVWVTFDTRPAVITPENVYVRIVTREENPWLKHDYYRAKYPASKYRPVVKLQPVTNNKVIIRDDTDRYRGAPPKQVVVPQEKKYQEPNPGEKWQNPPMNAAPGNKKDEIPAGNRGGENGRKDKDKNIRDEKKNEEGNVEENKPVTENGGEEMTPGSDAGKERKGKDEKTKGANTPGPSIEKKDEGVQKAGPVKGRAKGPKKVKKEKKNAADKDNAIGADKSRGGPDLNRDTGNKDEGNIKDNEGRGDTGQKSGKKDNGRGNKKDNKNDNNKDENGE
jgi:hypothetical protein